MPKFNVSRSIQINASRKKVFDAVADFGTWTAWSPWLCAEPGAKVTVSSDASSVGSLYSWNGEVVGAGEIEHKRMVPEERIEDEIRFLKPWKAVSQVTFTLSEVADGTELTWTMAGSVPWFLFFMKPMMKTMIGMDYDRGLKMLKEWLETGSVSASTEIKGVESVGPIRMAGVTSTCHVNDIAEDMGRSIELAEARFLTLKLPAEEGVSVYTGFKMSQGLFSYITGFMIPDSAAEQLEGLQVWSLPACKALRVDQTGCYTHLGNGWSAANQHARYKKLKQAKLGTFEIYRKSPHHTDVPSEYETEIYLPLR